MNNSVSHRLSANRTSVFAVNSNENIRCFNCNQFGHYRSDCQQVSNNKCAPSTRNFKRCNYCRKTGHLEAQCYKRGSQPSQNSFAFATPEDRRNSNHGRERRDSNSERNRRYSPTRDDQRNFNLGQNQRDSSSGADQCDLTSLKARQNLNSKGSQQKGAVPTKPLIARAVSIVSATNSM